MKKGRSAEKKDQPILAFHGTQGFAILPIGLYIILSGVLAIGFQFYGMEALIFAAIISILIGFLFCKNKGTYWISCVRGLASFGNARLIIVFIVIGIFSKTLVTGNIGGGLIWISLHLGLQGGSFTVFAFIGCAVIAMGAGAPFPALLALVPIFYPAGVMLGSDPGMLVGAMISGVFFGDACSPSSQVIHMTINSQHEPGTNKCADLIAVMKARSPYLVVIALISAVLFFFFGGNGGSGAIPQELTALADPRGLLMLVPIVLLLAICFKTRDLFLGVTWGIFCALVIGLVGGIFQFSDIISIDVVKQQMHGIFSEGIAGSFNIVFSTILLYALIQIAVEGGILQAACTWLLHLKLAHNPTGSEGIVAGGVGIVNVLLSGAVLPSIIMFQEVADSIGKKSGISANRRSILLTAMTTNITAIVPLNSAFIMGAITLVNGMAQGNSLIPLVTPFQIFIACFYPLLLTVVCFVWITFGWGREKTKASLTRHKTQTQQL